MIEFCTRQWLAERLPLASLLNVLKKKTIPMHRHSHWYYLGNVLLTCLLMQIITGIVLLFYYQPTPLTAYDSIRTIILNVPHGWLIRSIHKWGATFMIAAAWIHLFSVFFLQAYRRPRELTWLTGIILFVVVMGLGFSGYLLPWSEHAFFATRVGTGIAGQVPLIGQGLQVFLRGGDEVGAATLTRFFALHVIVFPGILAIMVGFHLLLIQFHGLSVPPFMEQNTSAHEQIPFFPEFMLRDLAVSCWLIAIVVILAVLVPSEIGNRLDPLLSTPDAVLPEWYFMFMFKTLQILPAKIGAMDGAQVGMLFFSVSLLLIILMPMLDYRSAHRQASLWFTMLGITMVLFILIMTLWAWLTTPASSPEITDNIHYLQSVLAQRALPGVSIFVAAIMALGILLWLKSLDLATLRKQGFYEKNHS